MNYERANWRELDQRRYEALQKVAEGLVELLATFDVQMQNIPMQASAPTKLLTVKQAAALLGIGTSRMYEMLRRTDHLRIPHIRIGTGYRIPPKALQDWIAGGGKEALAADQAKTIPSHGRTAR